MSRSRGRNRSGRKGGRGQNPGRQRRVFDPAKHFMPPPIPQREYEPCPLSGEPVKNVLTAIADPETGRPANFDSVLHRLGESEELRPNEQICYLGRGSFGILVDQKGKRPRYFVRKRFQFEDEHEKYPWRRELSPGISRDYVPAPQRLSELYDEAEAVVADNGFGRAHQSIYLPKND